MGDFIHVGVGALPQNGPHDEFLELCALSASGDLSEEEQKKLNDHLILCPSCRETLYQYEMIADEAISSLAAEVDHTDVNPGRGWSQKKAEKRFLENQTRNSQPGSSRSANDKALHPSRFGMHPLLLPSQPAWKHVWMLYAAGIVLVAAFGMFTYRVSVHPGSNLARVNPPALNQARIQDMAMLEAQLSDASHERMIARAQVAERDRTIADLKRQLAQQSDQLTQLRAAEEQLQSQLQTDDRNKADFAAQQADLNLKLQTTETKAQVLQTKLDSFAQQSAQDAMQAKASETKVNNLTKLLQDREGELEQQEQMLAHDRDIRDLMGARDLYIAEVYDVGDRGETKKPYGRVFYTRGKSLIFYAYDLDQQAELKRTGTFQAWGRRGPDRQQAVNLGIFYEDNSAKKRWVMKCEDLNTLAKIDGVFVTVEPNGGSHKPSNKTLLFAYLRVNPNHP